MRKHVYFEDSEVGETLTAPRRTITEQDILEFARMTGDRNPLHVDETFARKTVFGGRIAHGLLVLSIGSGLIFETAPNCALPAATIAVYSISSVRFLLPTYIGDTVHVHTEICELIEVDGHRGLIGARHIVLNQDGRTVIGFRTKTLVGRRPLQEVCSNG